MFDTYVVRAGGGSHYHNHRITEQRAPTDESVKLLREMEKAAQQNVRKTIVLPGNKFNAVIHQLRGYELDKSLMFKIEWDLNGTRHTTDLVLDYGQAGEVRNHPPLLGEHLVKALSEDIARVMLSASVHQLNMRELIR